MAKEKLFCFLAFAITILAIFGPAWSMDPCEADIVHLIQYCYEFVQIKGPKIPPSITCCLVVRSTDMPCACKHVNKEAEKIISMEKVSYVAERCDRPLAHGSKCGSYTVPSA
ncbi:hypothetical protein ACMD2_06835 [Ananas comosus]|uniref:Bifunctional inhibitor/plant lipid transfer protein/seed storage helical domain-containing protein n=1 Tax=Ananas comosus TaxID=4615 RepID=A0A199VBR8_ANACO|nr:hypothetical protein ACMD2_06835 [Ananas comosus]